MSVASHSSSLSYAVTLVCSLLLAICIPFCKKNKQHKRFSMKNRHAAPPTFPPCFVIAVMAAVAVAAAVSRLCHSSSLFCSISRISAFSSQFCSSSDSIRSRSLAAFAVARCSFFFVSSLSSAVWTDKAEVIDNDTSNILLRYVHITICTSRHSI